MLKLMLLGYATALLSMQISAVFILDENAPVKQLTSLIKDLSLTHSCFPLIFICLIDNQIIICLIDNQINIQNQKHVTTSYRFKSSRKLIINF